DPVHHAVHGAAVTGLEAGRVDEDELLGIAREHAVYAVPGRLRLARDDGKLGADQGIGQRRLADVGPAHHGHEAAAKGLRLPAGTRARRRHRACRAGLRAARAGILTRLARGLRGGGSGHLISWATATGRVSCAVLRALDTRRLAGAGLAA